MGFSRHEYLSGLPCPPPGDLPDPAVELTSVTSPASAGGFFTTGATWEAHHKGQNYLNGSNGSLTDCWPMPSSEGRDDLACAIMGPGVALKLHEGLLNEYTMVCGPLTFSTGDLLMVKSNPCSLILLKRCSRVWHIKKPCGCHKLGLKYVLLWGNLNCHTKYLL